MKAVMAAVLACAGTLGAADKPAIVFEDATAASGIQFVHSFGSQKLGSLLESTGAGCAWFDYNNDGRADLFVLSGRPLEGGVHPYPLKKPPAEMPHNHLYRNDGNGKFTDVTDQAGVGGDLYGMAAIAADFNNDGLTDLFVTGYGKAILYRNRGDGKFEDVTAKAGLLVPGWSIGSAWLDYNRDGCTDLFVGRYVKFDPKYRSFYAADAFPGPLDYRGDTNMLFKNNCDGTFTDVSEASGIAALKGRTMGVTAGDFDGDGFPDVYVANDKTENYLFHNQKDGTFKEIAVMAGVAYGQNGESTSAMGPVFVDYDNDGRADLWVSDSKYNRLLRNTGTAEFTDVTDRVGISQQTAQYVSWGTAVEDLDNDGYRDVFIAHGGLAHLIQQEHSLFRNTGTGVFADVASSAGPVFDSKTVGRGSCAADYDNDGRIDFFVVNLGSAGVLFHNVSPGANHWLEVRLVGKKSNKDGIGAKVEVLAGERKQLAERVAGSGYLGQDDWRLHFGMGAASKVDVLTVTWPSGKVQKLTGVAADRVVTVEEP